MALLVFGLQMLKWIWSYICSHSSYVEIEFKLTKCTILWTFELIKYTK